MPRGGDPWVEVSSASQQGTFRVLVNTTAGFGFKGGHLEDHGLDSTGAVVPVPDHLHTVDLDFGRLELELRYSFADTWDAWVRVPYETKRQTAEIEFTDPVTDVEREAILRNARIHHRTENYSGFSDLKFLVAHRKQDWITDGDFFILAFGSSIPTGQTEEDPFARASEGLEHLHIQFGSGTFDPLVELNYFRSAGSKTYLGTSVGGKLPLYANNNGYRGSPELTAALNGRYQANRLLSIQASSSLFVQGYASWSGARDVNSGLIAVGGMLGASLQLGPGVSLGTAIRFPLYQRTLSGLGDNFEYGPIIQVSLSVS